jgi:hypothetical protein
MIRHERAANRFVAGVLILLLYSSIQRRKWAGSGDENNNSHEGAGFLKHDFLFLFLGVGRLGATRILTACGIRYLSTVLGIQRHVL